nr:MAG TPA: Protein of unknown function (DUF4014) [Caudoviricetes sp.]
MHSFSYATCRRFSPTRSRTKEALLLGVFFLILIL